MSCHIQLIEATMNLREKITKRNYLDNAENDRWLSIMIYEVGKCNEMGKKLTRGLNSTGYMPVISGV